MKIKALLLLLGLTLLFSECKKGEDDPFLSLRSRKARVAGNWTLKSGEVREVDSDANSTETSTRIYTEIAYNDSYSYTSGGITTTSSDAGSHTLKIEFEKDGKFTYTETEDGDVYTATGVWNFTGGIGDQKKKQQIVLIITSSSGSGSSSTYTGNQVDITYDLKELRNKKMVLVTNSTYSGAYGSSSYSTELVMEQ